VVSVAYFDTSALIKYYVTESGSPWVRALLDGPAAPVIVTSRLTLIEMTCALARRLREGTLLPDQHRRMTDLINYDVRSRYDVMEVTPTAIETAQQLANRHPLRAYDAVQLSAAWLTNRELLRVGRSALMFLSADDRLLAIAHAEGLLTDNPNLHP
jgi:predicted nucleic acid-binding protein